MIVSTLLYILCNNSYRETKYSCHTYLKRQFVVLLKTGQQCLLGTASDVLERLLVLVYAEIAYGNKETFNNTHKSRSVLYTVVQVLDTKYTPKIRFGMRRIRNQMVPCEAFIIAKLCFLFVIFFCFFI